MQPIRVVNPAGCYADAAHPPRSARAACRHISPSLTATRARESGFGGGAAIPRRQSAHPGISANRQPAGCYAGMQPIRVDGNQPNLDGNQGAGIRFRGGRCYPAAAISPSGSSIPRAAMPMQPIRGGNQPILVGIPGRGNPVSGGALLSRGGNQPILDGNQGAGIRFRGGAAIPRRQSAHPPRPRRNPVADHPQFPIENSHLAKNW